MIPYGRQSIDEADIKAVTDVLTSDYLTQGPKIAAFEKAVAGYVGAKHAVAVSNGTAALHLACLAAGLKKGENIITSPLTFVASANCAFYCGARPRFADTGDDGLMNPQQVESLIDKNTKIVIPVHYSGMVCDMERIQAIAKEHKLIIIEDACHALGATYKGERVGSCSHTDMAVFSFHPVKHIATGEGGMITTNSDELYTRLMMLRTHGITKDQDSLIKKDEGPWYHEMHMLGYNYRMTDIQAALGLSQMKRLDGFVKRRQEIAKRYDEAFGENPKIETLKAGADVVGAYHLYPILVDERRRREIFERLREQGLWVQVHYIPVYQQPHYQEHGFEDTACPRADRFYRREISIPLYPAMTDDDVQTVIKIVKETVK